MNANKQKGIQILTWYKKNKRDLPWRKTGDPYKIWISEIMLQQTRVDTVIEYYRRFLERFPDIRSLAEAEEEEVLTLWKGLGYYSRARNLHEAARRVVQEHGGQFPDTFEQVRSLPGIGEYTAGAILSIAFNQPVPAVDGNVLRVITRLEGIREDITKDKVKKAVAQIVTGMMPGEEAGDFTQALMEHGAMVCTPQSPKCQQCPVASFCEAFRQGAQEDIPVKKKKNPPKEYHWWVAWIERDGKVLLEHRTQETLLANLWGFPMVEKDKGDEAGAGFEKKYGLKLQRKESLGTAKHVFTHQVWKMDVVVYAAKSTDSVPNTLVWKDIGELKDLAIPTVFQKVVGLYAKDI